ncbi:MAG: DUF456 domain-containing protein [Nocardioides sp.]
MSGTVIVCGVLVVVGIFGTVVPVLPGTALVWVGILLWASLTGSTAGWVVLGLATACLVVGAVVKYAVPGRRLKAAVPASTLVSGGVGAVVGFFLIPLVGALVGFPVGIYLAERVRVGAAGAWPSTRAALGAVGIGILIELLAALLATAVWVVGVVAT